MPQAEAAVVQVERGRADAARAVLVRLAWAGAALTAVSLPVSIAGMQIGAGVALGALLLWRVAGGRGPPVPAPGAQVALATLVLLGAALASIAIAALAGAGAARMDHVLYARGLALPLVFLLAIERGDAGEDPEAPRRRALALVVAWAVATLLPASIAWAQHRTGFDLLHALGLRDAPLRAKLYTGVGPLDVPTGRYGAVGFFSWYTRLALSLTPLAALAGGLALLAPLRRRTRVALALGAGGAAWAVVLTTSRAAWAGLAVAAVALALSAGRRVRRVALPLTVAVSVAAGCAVPDLRVRLGRAFSAESNADRSAIWRACRAVIADHPLTGVGYKALPQVGRPYYETYSADTPVRSWCHDTPLSAWAEGGPLLAGAVLAWMALLVRAFLRARRAGDPLARAAAAGALAALAALTVNALVHDVLWAMEPLYANGFLLAAAAVLAHPRSAGASRARPVLRAVS
ncbi:O-antigen ligase family protein [Anaeromyxobacter dehalogenans]|uniref:O-antigen ligase family protein n=1 Tax=Anaeromyxobacter dehalogenans TaxID=161493 RepID=UPI00123748DE|nr:O-antigen ligase family protein [Anaeromyxobacter dehalogenans]